MRTREKSFRHESLQDGKSIRDLLESITEGLADGRLVFSDEDGEIVMEPKGLLHTKLTVSKEESRHRINLRVTWQVEDNSVKKDKSLSAQSGKTK
ncbi:MAG: amphi-Trp domain-containing protein [Gammaproteobacteria bacterium]|nr:amphi-Trp domain-containing protein [Gammaproteobacteria bacterium]